MKYLLPVLLILPLAACAPRHEPAPVSCAGSIPLVSADYVAPAPRPVAPQVAKKPVYRKKRATYRRATPRKTATVAAKKTARKKQQPRQQAQVVTPPIPLPVTPVEPVFTNEAATHVYTPRLQ